MRITLDTITKCFGRVSAVDAVSFHVEQGECFFLLGPSGCGKTTILRIIAGFCSPDSGRILFDDTPVNHVPPYKRNTGMVFQQYALWPHMTVYKNIEFGLTVPGRNLRAEERKARVTRMLEIVHMEAFADRKPNQLSGGQQQRVALARALVVEPGCLLLDEPLSNLDAKLRMEMRVEIKRIVKTIGITTVYVTHDQEEALSMADRCAILRDGRVEQLGAPRELYERPVNRFVADFVGGTNLIVGTILSVSGDEARIKTRAGEWTGRTSNTGLRPGEGVVLSVRPERLHVADKSDTRPNTFSGKLKETMYYGDVVEHWIALSDGTTVKGIQTGPSPFMGPVNKNVRFRVDPTDVVILPAQCAHEGSRNDR